MAGFAPYKRSKQKECKKGLMQLIIPKLQYTTLK